MGPIKLELTNSQNHKIELFFNLVDASIGKRFLEALQQSLCLDLTERFVNFPDSCKDDKWIIKEIKKAILTINNYAPNTINYDVPEKLTQDDLNILHHYFETYHGPITDMADFFNQAPPSVQSALGQLNILIHQYEDWQMNLHYINQGMAPLAKIFLSFENRERFPLHDEDYKNFTLKTKFGGWYLDYCEVGKPLWDLYMDNDLHIGDQNIRPLRFYSADSFILFSPDNSEQTVQKYLKGFNQWWADNKDKLTALGFQQHDPKNAIGSIQVASLDRRTTQPLGP